MTLYPNGYGTTLLTLDQLAARHAAKMHPEFRRRFFALVQAGEGIIGIGGGWRSTEEQAASYARDPKGFAPPGSSFHESQTFASGIVGYQAIDTVGRNGRHSEAWAWLRANEKRFGLRSFHDINSEPWHVQCADIPLSVSQWRAAGRPDPSRTFVLAGYTPPPATPAPPTEDDDMPRSEFILKPPPGSPSTWPFLYACGGDVRPAIGNDVQYANANGVPVIGNTDDHAVRYRNLHIAAMSGRAPGE